MNKKSIIISLLLGGVIGLLVFNMKELSNKNDDLIAKVSEQNETIKTLSGNVATLINANNETSEKLITMTQDRLSLIEPIRKYDKKEYLSMYKMIMQDSQDVPEDIYDYTTDEEFNMICGVIEAEIGIGDFDQKCSVANVIVNRYLKTDTTWHDVLFEDNQFTTVSNGMYRKVEVSEDTRLALEYVFLFNDEDTKDCLYFKSGHDKGWHDKSVNLDMVYFDGLHYFYKEKEELK